MSLKNPILIISFGNEYRADDGAGPAVARLISELKTETIEVMFGHVDEATLLNKLAGAEYAFLIDAVRSGAEPGMIFRLEPLTQELPTGIFANYSTHSLGLLNLLEMARTLKKMPRSLVIYGIEGRDFSYGSGLSDEVKSAVKNVAGEIVAEIDHIRTQKLAD
jgi:hydrogenase maturation protease